MMPGRHASPLTLDSVVSEYVTRRARELVAEADAGMDMSVMAMAAWVGSATEILRELARDA
jgi:hypothetical protein